MSKSAHKFAFLQLLGRVALLSCCDYLRKIFPSAHGVFGNVSCSFQSARAGSEDAFPIRTLGFWRNDTVACKEYRSVKLGKFFLLFPPSVAIVVLEVAKLFEIGLIVGGQHLRVRVNVNSFSLALLQKFFEVGKVVSRNQYTGTLSRREFDESHLRIPERRCVCLVE